MTHRPLCFLMLLASIGAPQTPDRGAVRASIPNSGRRIALVIGNRAYPRQALENSVNDARDLGALLESQLNFQTSETGRGTKGDRNQAIEWYRKAVNADYDDAKAALKRLGVEP